MSYLQNKVIRTQIFNTKDVIPVTIIKGGPCYVTQIKSTEKMWVYCSTDTEIAENSKVNKTKTGTL